MQKIVLIPAVKEYSLGADKVKFVHINYREELSEYEVELLSKYYDDSISCNLKFYLDGSLNKEAYRVDISEDEITINYSTDKGKHNAILTLIQLLRNIDSLTVGHIYDEPDFAIRAIMIDISRNKVPTVETLKKIIDEVALVKINELQLYVEGRSFYFESYPQFYENKEDFLTGQDVLELQEYGLKRNVELIPNLNCFGHMAYWVNQKEFEHLKLEKEFYWDINGLKGYSSSINPELEESYTFLHNLFDDMLKYYPDANRITIGGDEPFELLFPVKNPNADDIYKNHIKKVVEYVNKKGIIPWMWGDVVKIYPELLEKLDAKFLEWGYEKGQFNDENCSLYHSHNKDFIACCGTSGWNSIAGRTDNMLVNMFEAAYFGKKYGALGYMITDWNDGASWSQLPTNMLAYIYGSCHAWNYEDINKDDINSYLDEFIYKTPLSESVLELGRYIECQEDKSIIFTKLFTMLYTHQMDGINYDINSYSDCTALFNRNHVLNYNECIATEHFLNKWISKFIYDENNQYCKELLFAYRLLKHSLDASKAYIKLRNIDCDISTMSNLLSDIDDIITLYDSIWHYRNKESDFYYSLRRLKMLRYKYTHIITLMKGDF